MHRIKYRKIKSLVVLLFLFTLTFTPSVSALELVISDNGSEAESEVNIEVETQTTVEQTNEANIENNVIEEVNTGGNEASGNTGGDVEIQTGDISTTTSIENQVNNSVVESETCCATTNLEISENGADSTNTVNLDQSANTNIIVTNKAQITNSITGSATTGENKANNNTGGSVSITTGDINVWNEVVNDPVNTSYVKASSGFSDVSAVINNNGADSKNTINSEFNDDLSVLVTHSSDIENYIIWDANSGDNEASGNTGGDVSITTGDIDIVNFIENFVNIGGVDVDCCKNVYDPSDTDDIDDDDGPRDETEPGDDSGIGGNSDSGSSTESSSGGSILPSAAATQAGGPGIAGLSDTSSDTASRMFFWISFAFITFGGKIIIEELLADTSRKMR